ncbi:putative prohead core protein [Erwinia phage pEa_SNUABM_50]|uniref:Prohead core scaffold and protease n=4 Tax=Eneladusvirus BF TaxID=2560751 RepID=A0A1S6UAL0_9CAUD|nr:prohead core scaffold and protease [Serratia phage BF]QOI71190.1 putative prohead core protein [Erwinia phage pEa_SNUABM_12]QOI71734.1 putative prohead core protein [Erwinia phage pEa_SNUABM_47]QOI72273.1 putative prohead core protein [Erwinia phage pEa_SNUABM_50]QXO11399.1 hypothetical protein pEaSNUABM19_00253 [Erwinia phage pEa_SNUABM_19]QXO11947.1 hypothetical protein pEaSNUABM44_00251 [Erwinia phage pEa_SNUABM_44]QXO12500.1 hypothetical protein pEaSNUABM49_00254 [Erwinia phage pEa_SNU
MSMLREWSSFNDSKIVLEYKEDQLTGRKNCYLKGIAIQADRRNLNERVYPFAEIARAVNNMAERISKGESILCECDHPETLTVNLDRVVGMITNVWMEGANGMATIMLLDTTLGKDIRTMIESGVKLGVSSRGSGNVDHNGVVSDFEIVTIDIVAQPSAPDAYPQAVFESLNSKYGAPMNGTSRVFESSKTSYSKVDDEIHQFFKNLKG